MKAISLLLLFAASVTHAQSGPASFSFDGTLLNSSSQPIVQPNVTFKFELLDKNDTCVLYSEQQSVDLSTTAGAFSVQVGTGTAKMNYILGTPNFTSALFVNSGATGAFAGCAAGVTLASGDERHLRVSYDLGSGFQVMSPNFPLGSVPSAMSADLLNGKSASDMLQVRSDAMAMLTQTNAEYAFSTTNWPKLQALLNGTSTQYLPSGGTSPIGFGGQRLISISDPVAASDAATKNYSDTNVGGRQIDFTGVGPGFGDGRTMIWDQAANRWTTAPPQPPGFLPGGNSFGTTAILGTNDSFGLVLKTAGANRMYLSPGGNIGVGTTAPLGTFSVSGGSGNPAVSGGSDPNVILRADNGANSLDMGVSSGWSSAWMQARNSSINGSITNLMLQPYGGAVSIGVNSSPGNASMLIVNNNGGSTTDTAIINGGSTGNNILTLVSNGTPRAVFANNGNVGIGTTAPSTALQVAGTIAPGTDNTYPLGNSGLRFASVYAVNGTIQTSDAREKKDIAESDLGLAFVNQLRPVSYRWRRGPDQDVHYGLIAQETEKVVGVKNVIVAHDLETDRYGIKYTELIAPLIKAVQELHAENAELKRRLEALEAR